MHVTQGAAIDVLCSDGDYVQIGMSENTVFKEYHEDGIKLFNKTMNMKQVVNELRDPKHRILNEVCTA